MGKTWSYRDVEVEEGLKPRDGHYKDGYHQYFMLAKKGGERLFKYCVWVEQSDAHKAEGHVIPESVYQQAQTSVRNKIDMGDNSDKLLLVRDGEVREVPLEELPKKLE